MTLAHMYKSRREKREQRDRDIQSVLSFLRGGVERKKIINFIEKYMVEDEL